MKIYKLLTVTFLLILSFLFTELATAQINVKGYVKEKAREKANEAVRDGIDDVIEMGNKDDENNQVEEEPPTTELEESNETPSEIEAEQDENMRPDEKPKMESYGQYDFVPGDQILFFEDFSQDALGDFPALWVSNGGGEVKTVNIAAGKWFHMNGSNAVYCYTKAIVFPENYIIEFDIIPDNQYYSGIELTLYELNPENTSEVEDDLYPGRYGLKIRLGPESWETLGYSEEPGSDWLQGRSEKNPVIREEVNHVIIWVQKRRLRIYHKGQKTLDVPTNIYAPSKFDRIRFSGWDSESFPFISNFKITTASPDMRSKLLTDGKLISYGIYFDSGKDIVKPESYGSLNDIAKVLAENPTVKINIVGHTDSDGDDAMNLDLSKRRAANVKNSLVKDFGIAADRITTDGKGETQALVPNTSVENKAINRRVEFIKL